MILPKKIDISQNWVKKTTYEIGKLGYFEWIESKRSFSKEEL
jgi:hypothetical protein